MTWSPSAGWPPGYEVLLSVRTVQLLPSAKTIITLPSHDCTVPENSAVFTVTLVAVYVPSLFLYAVTETFTPGNGSPGDVAPPRPTGPPPQSARTTPDG